MGEVIDFRLRGDGAVAIEPAGDGFKVSVWRRPDLLDAEADFPTYAEAHKHAALLAFYNKMDLIFTAAGLQHEILTVQSSNGGRP